MLPHVRQFNRQKRVDEVIALYEMICVDHPIMIDINKIKSPIQLINLAWILAICRKECNTFHDVNLQDMHLNAMAEVIRKSLIDKLHNSGKLARLEPKYFDEVDVVNCSTVTDTLSYRLPPKIIITLITGDQVFSRLVRNTNIISSSISDCPPVTDHNTKPERHEQIITSNRLISMPSKANDLMINNESRPSQKGSAKSEIIRLELETILEQAPPKQINRATLWQALLERAANKPESRFRKKGKCIQEKDTDIEWEREKANHHLDNVIHWHKSTEPTTR